MLLQGLYLLPELLYLLALVPVRLLAPVAPVLPALLLAPAAPSRFLRLVEGSAAGPGSCPKRSSVPGCPSDLWLAVLSIALSCRLRKLGGGAILEVLLGRTPGASLSPLELPLLPPRTLATSKAACWLCEKLLGASKFSVRCAMRGRSRPECTRIVQHETKLVKYPASVSPARCSTTSFAGTGVPLSKGEAMSHSIVPMQHKVRMDGSNMQDHGTRSFSHPLFAEHAMMSEQFRHTRQAENLFPFGCAKQ